MWAIDNRPSYFHESKKQQLSISVKTANSCTIVLRQDSKELHKKAHVSLGNRVLSISTQITRKLTQLFTRNNNQLIRALLASFISFQSYHLSGSYSYSVLSKFSILVQYCNCQLWFHRLQCSFVFCLQSVYTSYMHTCNDASGPSGGAEGWREVGMDWARVGGGGRRGRLLLSAFISRSASRSSSSSPIPAVPRSG